MHAAPAAMEPTAEDLQQLRLLSIFHYVVAAITGLLSLLPLFHLAVGLALVSGRFGPAGASDPLPFAPGLFGWFFVVVAALAILAGLALAGVMAYAGHCLAQHRRHLLCLVVAALSCMAFPLGTVLGVFTLLVLARPRVKALFQET